MVDVIKKTLFYRSWLLGCKLGRKTGWFWFSWYLKVMAIVFFAVVFLMCSLFGATLAISSLLGIKNFLSYASIHESLVSVDMFAWLKIVLYVMSVLGMCALLVYMMVQMYVLCYANALDIAHDKTPRGITVIKNIGKFLPLLFIHWILAPYFLHFVLPIHFSVWTILLVVVYVFIKYYLFLSRLMFTCFFMLDGASFCKAVKQSWNYTSKYAEEICLFGVAYLLLDLFAQISVLYKSSYGLVNIGLTSCLVMFEGLLGVILMLTVAKIYEQK